MSDAAKPRPKRQPRELSTTSLDVLARSVYLTVPEAAAYLRFRSVQAFECWVSRNPLPKARRGRTVLFFRKDLDAAVAPAYLSPAAKQRHKEES